MQKLNHFSLKHGFTTHSVPFEAMFGIAEISSKPKIGDLVAVEVLSIGQHDKLESREGAILNLFKGDRFIGAFGNRYATDQFEGYVPDKITDECDMLSIGGVFGEVASKHNSMKTPTRLKILGAVCDENGFPLSTTSFGLPLPEKSFPTNRAEIILVVGASMNSGKTNTCGMLARALSQAGFKVGAAKITGTAAGKDGRFIKSCGAQTIFDFTDAGYPSTYLLSYRELFQIYQNLVENLCTANPDFIVIEIADGIFQRETKMLIESKSFTETIDHLFFAANDSLSAECGVRHLQALGLPLRAVSGAMTQGTLNISEAEIATGMACLSNEMILDGRVLELLPKKHTKSFSTRMETPFVDFQPA